MAQSGATPEGARRINRRLVMRTIYQAGMVSRAEVAKGVGLTPASVSAVVRQLLDDELIEELAPSSLGGVGKPATPLAIRADGRHIAVIDLSHRNVIVGALVDLHGKVIERIELTRQGRVGRQALESVRDLAAQLISTSSRSLLGIGIASPGVVVDSCMVVESAHLAWHRVDVRSALSDLTNVPIIVLNDANAGALGEVMFGEVDVVDMVYVRIDDGVGAGIVLDGHLHVGPQGGGGEIGHIVVQPDGPPCACTNRGCLETVVSDPLSGAEPTIEAIEAAGRSLGAGLAGVVSTLDVDQVVVGGIPAALDQRFLCAVNDEIVARVLPTLASRLLVRATSLHVDDVLLGAAAIVLDAELGVR